MSTFLIHGTAQTARWDFSHHTVPPLSSSVTYRLDSAERGGRGFLQFGRGREGDAEPVYIYDRLDEPTRSILEDDLARAEGGEICCTFATGMAMYPIVPDYQKYPESGGRSAKDTYGEIGLGAHWIKAALHFMFIYKAKAKPGWFLIPE